MAKSAEATTISTTLTLYRLFRLIDDKLSRGQVESARAICHEVMELFDVETEQLGVAFGLVPTAGDPTA